MNSHPDVIIVGGGIIGCLAAYYLGGHGLSTVIVERDAIGSQASGNAAGILTPYSGAGGPVLQAFAEESHRLHRELAQALPEETGIGYHYGLGPFLRVALTEEDEGDLRRWYDARRREGHDLAWLSGEEGRRLSGGWLSPEARAVVPSELEPQVDPYRLVLAVATAAEALGSRIRTGEVAGIQGRDGRATGVVLADGATIPGHAVLLAMGPWTKLAGPWAGLRIPVEPVRGQIVRLSVPGTQPPFALLRIEGRGYILRKPSGEVFGGTTWERVGFDQQATPEGQASIVEGTLRLSPRARDAVVEESRACLRPYSEDEHPIIGPAPGWENLYIAAGHGPEGILMGPATGKYLAQLIATGRSDYDLSPFSPGRFPPQPGDGDSGSATLRRHG
jgi:glycine oxidase